ncbi:MAG: hypothetical protein D6722_20860 [Bacteroidetes bacterium]|nr:MAG: hypothetical protein D6722_20860 [Bacteroidota bacterium]
MRILSSIWLAALLFLGCSFDQDLALAPRTVGAYLLATDSLGASVLLAYEDGTFVPDRAADLGLGRIYSLDSRDGRLWLGGEEQVRAFGWEAERLQAEASLDCAPLRPDYLCAGDRYLLIADTSKGEIGFVSQRDGGLHRRRLSAAPGRPVYRSGKFFLPVGARQVQVWQEVALTAVDSVTLQRPVVDLQIEPRTVLWVHTRGDSGLYAAPLDFNTHTLTAPETPVSGDTLLRSPYLWRTYGYELLGRVSLLDGRLRPSNQGGVAAVAADFLEGDLYFVQSDSLWRYRLRNREAHRLGAFPYRLRQAAFLPFFPDS